VATLDGTHLNVEKLTNMMGLLPTSEETNSLKRFSENEKSNFDGLGRAELFFLSVMKIPRFTQKLEVFQYSLQFDDQVQCLMSSLQTLGRACNEVVGSKKLAGILRRLLQIGNLMNESTGKPEAKGITLDSLIKTAKKKSNDGRIMVIDLVVSQTLAKNLDVDFWSDMPAVRVQQDWILMILGFCYVISKRAHRVSSTQFKLKRLKHRHQNSSLLSLNHSLRKQMVP